MGETKDFKVEQIDFNNNLHCSERIKPISSLILPKTMSSETCSDQIEPIPKKVQLSCPELVKSKKTSNCPRTSQSALASIPVSRGFDKIRTLRRKKPSLLGSACRCFCEFLTFAKRFQLTIIFHG